jgi:uncharacterized protein YggE
MKTRNLLVLLVFCAMPMTHFVKAQVINPEEKPTIEVIGRSQMELIPDEIYISIILQDRKEGWQHITLAEQETSLREALLEMDVQYLSRTDANANYVPIKFSSRDVVSRAYYQLKLTDSNKVGVVFELFDELKVKEAKIERVSHSAIVAHKKKVRIDAIKAAKEKADYLLNAIGQKTGSALKVREIPYDRYDSSMGNRVLESPDAPLFNPGQSKVYYLNSGGVIQFQKIGLQASVYAEFEID